MWRGVSGCRLRWWGFFCCCCRCLEESWVGGGSFCGEGLEGRFRRWGGRVLYFHSRGRYPHHRCCDHVRCLHQRQRFHSPRPHHPHPHHHPRRHPSSAHSSLDPHLYLSPHASTPTSSTSSRQTQIQSNSFHEQSNPSHWQWLRPGLTAWVRATLRSGVQGLAVGAA